MNKLLTKIVGMALGASMAIGVGVAVASNSEAVPVHAAGGTFTKITSTSDLTSGAKYLIVSESDNKAFDGSLSTIDAVSNTKSVTISSNSITATSDFYFTITSKTGGYSIKGSGGNYIGSTSSNANELKSGTSDSYTNTITWDATNSCFIIRGSNSYLVYNSTSGQTRFRFFKPGTCGNGAGTGSYHKLSLYKEAASKTLSSISVSTAPTKTSYLAGEYFDPTGLVITRSYSDSTSDTYPYAGHTSDFTFSPTTSTALITSNTSVTITYGGKSTSQAITVTAPKTPASVSSSGQTTTFDSGDTFAYGGTLTATYTDSTSAGVTPTSFKIGNAGINPTSAGTVITPGSTALSRDDHNGKTVYVLYTENNTTVYTSYVIAVNAVSSVTFTAGTDVGTTTANNSPDSVTKSGITMDCDDAAFATAEYRYYSGSTLTFTSNVGKMAKIEFTGDTSKKMGNISLSSGGGEVTISDNDATWTAASGGTNEVVFTFSAQNRATEVKITLASTDPLVELAASSATSVTMMKGGSDTTVKVHVVNITTKTWTFTYDEGGNTGLTTSSYIDVSAGAAVSDVHTLTITTKAVGSTVLHIAVSGTACETTIPVTVNAKPASMTIIHGDIHEGAIEIITGKYKLVSFSGEDTDGNPYAIAAGDVTPSATSGASHVTLSGSKITGASAGDAVVRYTLNALTSVYAEITVHVVDDYIETVGTPTFAPDLTDTQGQSPDVSVFTSRPGTLHSGSSTTVPFENYKFSYSDNYASAKYGSAFTYDFSHGTTVDSTHKSQTIYVFCDIDEAAHGSYTVTVEQFNDPLTAITFTNVVNNAVDVTRGNSFQLEWAYTPTNPTDGKGVEFIIGDDSDGIDITVSELGLISIGASSDLGDALVIIQSTHDDSIQDYVVVSAVLGTMKYTVSEAESWTKVTDDSTLSVGDVIVIANYSAGAVAGSISSQILSGVTSGVTFSTSSTITELPDTALQLTLGGQEGAWTLSNSDGQKLGATAVKKLAWDSGTTTWDISISDSGATIQNGTSLYGRFLYNSDSPRFTTYTSATSSSMLLPQLYLKSGGDVEMDVTEALFNAIHNNFGEGKTYEWSESCPSFDDGKWADACEVILDLTDYDDYKLNRAVANASGNEVEQFLAKYDNIIEKFGTDYDYLERYAEGGINAGAILNRPVISVIDSTSATIAIVVVSMITMASFGGYFFLRKKKEEK